MTLADKKNFFFVACCFFGLIIIACIAAIGLHLYKNRGVHEGWQRYSGPEYVIYYPPGCKAVASPLVNNVRTLTIQEDVPSHQMPLVLLRIESKRIPDPPRVEKYYSDIAQQSIAVPGIREVEKRPERITVGNHDALHIERIIKRQGEELAEYQREWHVLLPHGRYFKFYFTGLQKEYTENRDVINDIVDSFRPL